MPDSKVALFIDFDNIRIGIRQHFGGELHPQKLMNKASKYGRVVTAKAYADFTGHPREFQDRLLFAAGIEPIHAPSKLSGGRRQSSADMHMVIDMFLEAIDNQDIDTFILMTGDADFVRMVATLRRRFGRRVIVSGVQSTSTSLDLMNAADARDPITKQDCDMTGELGRMTRPLVTRADLDAQAYAASTGDTQTKGRGLFGGLFRRKASAETAPAPAPTPAPAPSAPRRMRATELRGGAAAAQSRAPRSASTGSPAVREPARAPRSTGRGRQAPELPPIGPRSEPDDFEQKLVQEIFTMAPGRSGFKTIKTIEETLRSKAGKLGGTRKEIPARLERLEVMGLFTREHRQRGAVEVPTGELVLDHPTVKRLTAGLSQPEAKPRTPRAPRQSRRAEVEEPESALEDAATDELPAEVEPEVVEPAPEEPVVAAEESADAPAGDDAVPFRWVSPPGEDDGSEPAEEPKKPARRAPRKTSTSSAKSKTSRSKASAAEAEDKEPTPA